VSVLVEDDGRGFEVMDFEQGQGMGLKLIKERVEMINGEFEVTSQVGEGTRVALSVPESVL
jgi:two-component system sensor histidine kinase DegS